MAAVASPAGKTPFYAIRLEASGVFGGGIYCSFDEVYEICTSQLLSYHGSYAIKHCASLADAHAFINGSNDALPLRTSFSPLRSPRLRNVRDSYDEGGGGGGGEELFSSPKKMKIATGAEEVAPRAEPIDKRWVHAKIKELHPNIKLDVLQEQALEKVLVNRSNIFITGPGGVGKSFLTKLIIDLLKAHYEYDYNETVMVTASTGIASTHIGGTTIHTALGCGVPKSYHHFNRIFHFDSAIEKRISLKYEVIFIDEISMLSGEMLDALDDILQLLRKSPLPFGGLQVVMCGDFAQLPPITDEPKNLEYIPREEWTFNRHEEFYNVPVIHPSRMDSEAMVNERESAMKQHVLFTNRGLAFQSNAWWNFDLHIVTLTKVFRQDDEEFVALLNRMRKGELQDTDITFMNRVFYHQGGSAGGDDALHLYPKNRDVERRNKEKLDSLPHPLETFKCLDFVWHSDSNQIIPMDETYHGPYKDERERREISLLLKNYAYYRACLAAESVELKIGAKVLLLKNLDLVSDHKLVNGSRGEVVGWTPEDKLDYDVYEVDVDGEVMELPFPKAPRPDGAELKSPAMDNGKERKKDEKQRGLSKHRDTILEDWVEKNKHRIPLVRFTNGRTKAIIPEMFSEDIVNVGCNCRIQLPLMKGFAVSIHKSQGMTLDEAKVDLQGCFDGGQAYVAVSRVGPREGLRFLRPISRNAIKVNPVFLLWTERQDKMQEKRATLLRLLKEHQRLGEHEHVASLGLKGLHEAACALVRDQTRWSQMPPILKQAWCALKYALEMLKPGNVDVSAQHVGTTAKIQIWQSLPWKRGR